jgi:hypothetical protein
MGYAAWNETVGIEHFDLLERNYFNDCIFGIEGKIPLAFLTILEVVW